MASGSKLCRWCNQIDQNILVSFHLEICMHWFQLIYRICMSVSRYIENALRYIYDMIYIYIWCLSYLMCKYYAICFNPVLGRQKLNLSNMNQHVWVTMCEFQQAYGVEVAPLKGKQFLDCYHVTPLFVERQSTQCIQSSSRISWKIDWFHGEPGGVPMSYTNLICRTVYHNTNLI